MKERENKVIPLKAKDVNEVISKVTAKSQRELLVQLREQELKEAFTKIQSICQEYQCGIEAEVTITSNQIIPKIKLIDLQK